MFKKIKHIKKISKGGYPQFGKIKLREDEILKLYPNIKKAEKTPLSDEVETRQQVQEILKQVEQTRDDGIREISRKFDKYEGDVVISREKIEAVIKSLDQKVKDDVQFSYDRVRKFAEHQLKHLNNNFEVELSPGLFAGQKLIPVNSVGCYVPGGRYNNIASAVMSITTAKVAGVKNVIAASPPKDENGANPIIVYTANLCGADIIMNVGGIAAIGAFAYGCFGNPEVDMIVGPGNQYVAEAKRLLFGKVGIDLFAGPTEIGIIADHAADQEHRAFRTGRHSLLAGWLQHHVPRRRVDHPGRVRHFCNQGHQDGD